MKVSSWALQTFPLTNAWYLTVVIVDRIYQSYALIFQHKTSEMLICSSLILELKIPRVLHCLRGNGSFAWNLISSRINKYAHCSISKSASLRFYDGMLRLGWKYYYRERAYPNISSTPKHPCFHHLKMDLLVSY